MYIVQAGDTVSAIAQRFSSRVEWILEANKMRASDVLRIGQALVVPQSPATPTPTPTVPVAPQSPTPTEPPALRAPALLSPAEGAVLPAQEPIVLTWASVGILGADEWYVVTMKAVGDSVPVATWWTKSTSWRVPDEYRGRSDTGDDFTWQVQVRQGTPERPGASASPPSPVRLFTWR
jgi:phage tail protein X